MWLDDDMDKVAAWLRARHEVCPKCGTTESDWIDPVTHRFHDTPKWQASTYRCHGCAELERASAEVPEREPGVRIVLIPATENEEEDDAWT